MHALSHVYFIRWGVEEAWQNALIIFNDDSQWESSL